MSQHPAAPPAESLEPALHASLARATGDCRLRVVDAAFIRARESRERAAIEREVGPRECA